MYYLEHEPDTLAPFLRGLIRRFLASQISNPSSKTRQTSSMYLQSALEKPEPSPESVEGENLKAEEKYNLEAIPGL